MRAYYEPSSDFLIWVINEDAPLTGAEFGEANLRRVIELTADDDVANRDWAAFVLGNVDLNTPVIRTALLTCADDTDGRVRAEAIRGLARKDRSLALPYVKRALAAPPVKVNVFEAAALVAHPSLVQSLLKFATKTDDESFDELVRDALLACQSCKPDLRYK
jgi:hypothetical protein